MNMGEPIMGIERITSLEAIAIAERLEIRPATVIRVAEALGIDVYSEGVAALWTCPDCGNVCAEWKAKTFPKPLALPSYYVCPKCGKDCR